MIVWFQGKDDLSEMENTAGIFKGNSICFNIITENYLTFKDLFYYNILGPVRMKYLLRGPIKNKIFSSQG